MFAGSNFDNIRNELTNFLACVLRTVHLNTSYTFPLSSTQLQETRSYWTMLETHKKTLPPISTHHFVFSLLGSSAPDSEIDQFKCPLTCWLAVSSVRGDGLYCPPHDYTRVLSRWTYNLQNLHFYEAFLRIDEFHGNLFQYVTLVLLFDYC